MSDRPRLLLIGPPPGSLSVALAATDVESVSTDPAEVAERLRRDHPEVEHPLVHEHPITGRKGLYLSPLYARRIVGPAGADGRLLAHLHTMLDEPHVQMRWRWRHGDFVIWDETSTCHRALTDHHPQRRVMRRCVTGAEWAQ